MKKSYETVGGQAVIEGVMMKSTERTAMAVRNEAGEILYTCKDNSQTKNKLLKLPFIRGCVNFFKMLVDGVGYINKSSAMAFNEEEENVGGWFMVLSVFLGISLAVVMFIFLPTFFASYFRQFTNSHIIINLIEGLLRIIIFIAYLLAMSLFPDMKRFFMYHGAEHKTIMCSEKGMDLTVENVRSATRLHPRCGTTFMFLLMIISILVYSTVIWTDHLLWRTVLRVVLLPVVAGVSYEILKALARTENKCFYIFKWPGLMLQKITTKEPTDDMIEVAIVAFKGAKLSESELDGWKSGSEGIGFKDYVQAS